MIITLEACKPDTYVGCPAPAVTPPTDCEAGYEIGNGTIVCASVPAQREPLAATGGDLTGVLVTASIALVLISFGFAMVSLAYRAGDRRARREKLTALPSPHPNCRCTIEPAVLEDDRGSLER